MIRPYRYIPDRNTHRFWNRAVIDLRFGISIHQMKISRSPSDAKMPNSDPEGQIFLSAPSSHDRFFFLLTFWSPVFDFNVGVTIKGSLSYTLNFAILKIDVCDVAMMSSLNDRVTWPIQSMYWQRVIFRFLSIQCFYLSFWEATFTFGKKWRLFSLNLGKITHNWGKIRPYLDWECLL